ncbi:MAG: hypothetical protein WBA57_01445 [Elainellaceae cyanobacterium]
MRNLFYPIWRSPWLRPVLLAVVLSVPVGALTALILRGSYWQFLIQAVIVGTGGQIIVGIVLVAGAWWFWRRSPTSLRILRYAAATALFLVLQASLSLPLGEAIATHDQHQIKAYCESLIPLLEAHAAAHGEYPATIQQLDQAPDPPAAMRDEIFYHRRDQGYEFTVLDNRELFGWWTLPYGQQEWQHIVD